MVDRTIRAFSPGQHEPINRCTSTETPRSPQIDGAACHQLQQPVYRHCGEQQPEKEHLGDDLE